MAWQGRRVCAIVMLLCLVASAILGSAQEVERHVFVTVLDAQGTPVDGLTAEHFAVRESGRDCRVVRLEPLRTPMHLAVLVDTTVGEGMPDERFRSAIDAFLARMAGAHRVAVYASGNRPAKVADYTQDIAELKRVVSGMFARTQGGAHLIDTIDLALSDMRQLEPARPVIVAITSESAEASRKTAGKVIKDLIARATVLHAVVLTSATGSSNATRISKDIPTSSQQLENMIVLGEGDRERNQLLQQGTSTTGGSMQRVTTTTAVGPALTRVSAELTSSYRLTFNRQGADGPLKNLQVGVMLEGVTLRATPAAR